MRIDAKLHADNVQLAAKFDASVRVSGDAVKFTEQDLTYDQKTQARKNIDAIDRSYNIVNGFNDILKANCNFGVCRGIQMGSAPTGMCFPIIFLYGNSNRGITDLTLYDSKGQVWNTSNSRGEWGPFTLSSSDKLPAPTTAQVGQIVKVKAVDTSGKITETEPVDMPSGGGKETWEIVADITLAENATRILAEFEPCEKIKVILYIQSSATGWVRVFPNTATRPGGTDRAHIAIVNITKTPNVTRILIDFGVHKYISVENMYIATYSVAQRGDQNFGNLEINAGAMYHKDITGRYAANLDSGVNKILVEGASDDGLGAGTRLTIYGVKK